MAKKNEDIKTEKREERILEAKIAIEPLTQEFSHVSEMNILRDKINEIIRSI